jgi:sigma-B regulation protein RsbQ
MTTIARNNVKVVGTAPDALIFAHGFGCDQDAWRDVTPAFRDQFRIVSFDYVGFGGSDVASYDRQRYSGLDGYAADVIEILDELDVSKVAFVGHSVSAMIGLLAAIRRPDLFASLIMICPSPCYIDDGGYRGGFTRDDILSLLDTIDSNFFLWSRTMAPVVMGNGGRPYLGKDLADSFCRADPEIAKDFARTTFLSDFREQLPDCPVPSLILQTAEDTIAPIEVGQYMHKNMPRSTLVNMAATGHCPHISAAAETVSVIENYLRETMHV